MIDWRIIGTGSDYRNWLDVQYMEIFIRALISRIGMEVHDNHLYLDLWGAQDIPDSYGTTGICMLFIIIMFFLRSS